MSATAAPESRTVNGGNAAPEGHPLEGNPNFEELIETMEFDPFGPTSRDDSKGKEEGEAQAPAAEPDPTEPAPREPKPQPVREPQTPEPAPAPAPDGNAPEGGPKDDTTENLRQLVSNLIAKEVTGKRQETQTAPQAQPQGQPQPTAQPRSEAPAYQLQFPDEIVEALESDDRSTRKAALNGIANSIMNRLASDFSGALREVIGHIQQRVVPSTVNHMTTAQQEQAFVRHDFYGNFPELAELAQRIPDVETAIWRTVQQAAQAGGVQSWNPEFRNQVGNYLVTSFGIQRKGAQSAAAAPAPAVAKPPPRRAPFAAGSGSPARAESPGGGNDYMDVLLAGQ